MKAHRGRVSGSTKDFGPIRADYAFFEDHATEAAEDARAYAPHVRRLAGATRSIRRGFSPNQRVA